MAMETRHSNKTSRVHENVTIEEYGVARGGNAWDILEGMWCYVRSMTHRVQTGPHCDWTWDGFICWPLTPANHSVSLPCPDLPDTPNYEMIQGVEVTRWCTGEGTWFGDKTNYSICVKRIDNVYNGTDDLDLYSANLIKDIYFGASWLSLFFLVITLFIFTYFRSLQCIRISIHKNLVVSFIVRFVVEIIIYEPYVFTDHPNYTQVEWLCKLIKSLAQYALLANFFWMFVEGLFLHNRIVVSVFSTKAPFKLFYFIGWGLPAIVTLAWAICMTVLHDATHPDTSCWQGYSTVLYILIIYAPIALSMVANTVFLIRIIHILVVKLRANNAVETDQLRKAVKATVILFPLLGVTNALILFPADKKNLPYRIVSTLVQTSQGIFVSVLYCFLNGEVRMAIKKKWYRFKLSRVGQFWGARHNTSRSSSVFMSQSEAAMLATTRSRMWRPRRHMIGMYEKTQTSTCRPIDNTTL